MFGSIRAVLRTYSGLNNEILYSTPITGLQFSVFAGSMPSIGRYISRKYLSLIKYLVVLGCIYLVYYTISDDRVSKVSYLHFFYMCLLLLVLGYVHCPTVNSR